MLSKRLLNCLHQHKILGVAFVVGVSISQVPLASLTTFASAEDFQLSQQATPGSSQVKRKDFYVESDPGIQTFVREVLPANNSTIGVPMLLLHGGGAGGLSNYDLDVHGYSLAAVFARAGHPVYIMDVRGFGNSTFRPKWFGRLRRASSTRPASMNQPIERCPPAVSSEEAVRDISAVVDWIRTRQVGERVALVGWATGGHWAGMYTSRNNDKVSHLVMLNSLYGVNAPWEYREKFEAPDRPGQFDPNARDRLATAEGLIANWSATIPVEDLSQWRDPTVAQAYQQTALLADPALNTRTPPSLRIPGEFRREAYNLSLGQKYWEAADITVPTLVMRGERDHWSRPEDMEALEAELVNVPKVKTVTIADGTHFLFLDRPEHGRDRFISEVLSFLEPDL